jgi:hypothetical protein
MTAAEGDQGYGQHYRSRIFCQLNKETRYTFAVTREKEQQQE